jgi:hypothetical protein
MKLVANYEIKTECSTVTDELVLRIQHPKGLYRARIQNIPRSVYTTPFLLSLHLYFEAPSIEEAQDVADSLLVDCLNMLAFTTGSRYQRHRIRQIVDATPGKAMRRVLMWSDAIEYENPQPFLDNPTAQAIERLSTFDIPPAIRRAMRWYRLGINSTVPDDQFMNFWFALEIVAEFQKSPERVPDRCPKCRSPLYCESCKTHPDHRPFAKQAIRALLKAVDKDCDDATLDRLEMTRNSLMHGKTLKEIEDSLPEPHEEIVDVLGQLLWMVLIHQFPKEMFDGTLSMGSPSTYLHRKINAVAHIETFVPVGEDGDFDLSFTGTKAEMVPSGPPQSAKPTVIRMSVGQFERLENLRYVKGDRQDMCRRIYERNKPGNDGHIYALVISTDMATIKDALKRNETGDWQDLFREILEGTAKGPDEAAAPPKS